VAVHYFKALCRNFPEQPEKEQDNVIQNSR